jgi:ribose transport system permease protein
MRKKCNVEHASPDSTFLVLARKLGRKQTTGVFVILLALVVILSILRPDSFLTVKNLASVGRAFSYNAIIAIGMTFVIITGGIDLSVGAVFGFTAIVTGIVATRMGLGTTAGIIAGLLTGSTIGVCNGLLITKTKISPFIATMGTLSIVRGLAYGLTNGSPVIMPDDMKILGQALLGPIPITVIYMVVLAVLFGLVLGKTIFGRRVFTIGGSEQAALFSGIDVDTVKIVTYAICGLLAAFSGMMTTARMGVAQSGSGSGYELDAIAAVVIGGTSMSGGKGCILGSVLGAAIIGVLSNALVLLSVSAYWQQTVTGSVILIAVIADMMRYRNSKA